MILRKENHRGSESVPLETRTALMSKKAVLRQLLFFVFMSDLLFMVINNAG